MTAQYVDSKTQLVVYPWPNGNHLVNTKTAKHVDSKTQLVVLLRPNGKKRQQNTMTAKYIDSKTQLVVRLGPNGKSDIKIHSEQNTLTAKHSWLYLYGQIVTILVTQGQQNTLTAKYCDIKTH